jgi:hypothetical protein
MGLLAMLLLPTVVVYAQSDTAAEQDYYTVSGVVRNKDNRRKLENVTISLPGANLGTVTNADGVFSLKIKKSLAVRRLQASYVGFLNTQVTLNGPSDAEFDIYMVPAPNVLKEVVVYANPRTIIEEALAKVAVNYPETPDRLTGFYRETVQKRSRYISVAEAVVDIYKSNYADRTVGSDRVRVQKGRRLLSQKASDTLAVKVAGGPTLSIYLDAVKNPDALLDAKSLGFYQYKMEDPIALDNRTQYVVSFQPAVTMPYALYNGRYYIDYETLSFTRIEFSLDVRDQPKAIDAVLQRKPVGLRFRPTEVSYVVTYQTVNDKSYLNYLRNEIRFRCDWKRRLFSTGYTVLTEMVVTDRRAAAADDRIAYRDSFKERQIFYDLVDTYWSEDFWKAYNIIEPTESLEHAVNRLRKTNK